MALGHGPLALAPIADYPFVMRRFLKQKGQTPVLRWVVLAGLLCFATGFAWSNWSPSVRIHHSPMEIVAPETWSACVDDAARLSGVDRSLFEAIVVVESGRHPYVFGWTTSGVRHTYKAASYEDAVTRFQALERQQVRFDVGVAQINSRNLRVIHDRTGLAPLRALDPCTNLYLAGLILREQIKIHGRTWKAVAGYNGRSVYAARVHRALCAGSHDGVGCRSHRLSDVLCEPLPIPL